jgi:hypothetical protein
VTGRINDVDTMVAPEAGRRGCGNGDTALSLLLHPIHRCSAFVNLAHLMRHTRVIQDALSRRGLAGIDVRHDANISCMF